MSISQNFPSTRPSLNLNFARSQKLDPRITFTRSSTATYTGGDGLIKTAATDTPRFDFNATTGDCLGLLIEESRTNLTTYSEQIDNAAWGKTNTGITTNTSATTAPDGNTTADKLVENSANGIHNLAQSAGTISGTYTLSCFVKAAGRYKGYIQLYSSGGNAAAFFDLNLGTITASTGTTTITPYPNDWYRVTASTTFTSALAAVYIVMNDNSGNSTYTGDGTSGLYLWGAQVEEGAFPTSYIPTVASTVTRSADNASITGTNFSSFYNPSEGSVLFSGRTGGGTEPCFLTFSNAATSPTDIIRYTFLASSTISRFLGLFSSGTIFDIYSANTFTSGSLFKTAGCYKLNDFANVLNGGTVGTDTSGNVPVVNRLHLGDVNGYATYLNGTISQLSYYPVRLSNSQLQTLTK